MPLPKYYEDKGQRVFHFIKLKRRLPIIGIRKMKYEDLKQEVESGEGFVVFPYSVFMLFIYLRGVSSIYYRKNSLRTNFARIRYIILSSLFFLGTVFLIVVFASEGLDNLDLQNIDVGTIVALVLVAVCIIIPIPSIVTTFKGGIDVTNEVMDYIESKNQTKSDEQLAG